MKTSSRASRIFRDPAGRLVEPVAAFDDEIGVDWRAGYPSIADWLEQVRAQPRWAAPYDLMPGHPLPGRG